MTFISAHAQKYTYDVNNDGMVSIIDVTCLVNKILSIPNQGDEDYNYDVNDDGVVNITDVTWLVNHILGIANPEEDETSHLPCPDGNHPHVIDLGLPSGTLWACCNVGAQKPTDYGGYYAWGETQEKDYYLWDTYTLCGGDEYSCQDLGDDIAGSEYDVAYVKWGEPWCMPSSSQVKELIDYCDYEWTTINDVKGMKFTADNGGVVFLPAAGYFRKDYVSTDGKRGYYWASSAGIMGLDYASSLYFSSERPYWSEETRDCGRSVRPVSNAIPNLQLSKSSLVLVVGGLETVNITSGSGEYTVTSSDETVASATISNNTVKVKARARAYGETTITVTDEKSGQTATLEVKVFVNIQLSKDVLDMVVGSQETVEITSGYGSYLVESSDEEVVTAVIENGVVNVMPKKKGEAVITVTDLTSGMYASLQVNVSLYVISNAIVYLPTRFFSYRESHDERYYNEIFMYDMEVYGLINNVERCKLTFDEDFTYYFKDCNGNVVDDIGEKGEYTLVVKGIGDWLGEVSKSFFIVEGGSWSNHKAAGFSKIDSEHGVITITSEEELALLASIFNSKVDDRVPYAWWTIRLERDLDLSPYEWTPIGCGRPGDEVGFLGYFDAQGHTIKGVHFNHSNTPSYYYPQGLFGGMTHDGAINDLTLTESQISCSHGACVGGIVGYVGPGTKLTNCHVTSSVDVICPKASSSEAYTNEYGGIAGFSMGVLSGCTSAANVFKVWDAGICTSFGGILGNCNGTGIGGQIINCLYYGDQVFCSNSQGAIVGSISNGNNSIFDHCFYTSNTVKACNGSDVNNVMKVKAFDMNNVTSVDYGGDMMKSYDYGGMKVYPNAIVFKGVCYTQPQYVHFSSGVNHAPLQINDTPPFVPTNEKQQGGRMGVHAIKHVDTYSKELWE